ncbi:Uncharacterised protein [Turicibacter sanguinis]|nr:Uncharacterised protein [Turicibacter sanguinis]
MEQNKVRNIIALDVDTGEIEADLKLRGNQRLGIKSSLTQEQKEYLENERAKKAFTSSLGGFVTVFYFNNQALFDDEERPNEVISKANVTRLMMLATYMNYENQLVLEPSSNKIIKVMGAVEYMGKKDIQRVLNLKDYTFKQFFKEVTSANILIEENGRFVLNENYFRKGDVKRYVKEDSFICNYTRMYIDTVRQIYNGGDSKKHSILTYVFQLIPCIHYSTNFLCNNNSESYTSIDYMNLEDICKFLGLSTDKGNMSKFKKDLMSIHIKYRGESYHLFNEIIQSNSSTKVQRFLVNPLLVTSMYDMDNVKATIKKLFID